MKLGENVLKAGVDTVEKYIPQKQKQPTQKRGKTKAGKYTTGSPMKVTPTITKVATPTEITLTPTKALKPVELH